MGLLSHDDVDVIQSEEIKNQKRRKPYAIWSVDGYEYKLKLMTQEIVNLESKIGMNLLSVISKAEEGNMPPLKIMLLITHGAMKKFNHGVKEQEVIDLFDKYCDEGGDQLSFMTDVFLPIYQVSGFFSQAQAETMETQLVEAKELM